MSQSHPADRGNPEVNAANNNDGTGNAGRALPTPSRHLFRAAWFRTRPVCAWVGQHLGRLIRTYPHFAMFILGVLCFMIFGNDHSSLTVTRTDTAGTTLPVTTITVTQTALSSLPPGHMPTSVQHESHINRDLDDPALVKEICGIYIGLVSTTRGFSTSSPTEILDRDLFEHLALPSPRYQAQTDPLDSNTVYSWEAIRSGLEQVRSDLSGVIGQGVHIDRINERGLLYQISVLIDDKTGRETYINVFLSGVGTEKGKVAERVMRVCGRADLFRVAEKEECTN